MIEKRGDHSRLSRSFRPTGSLWHDPDFPQIFLLEQLILILQEVQWKLHINRTQSPGAVKSYYLTAEIDPPKGTNLEGFLTTALSLRGRVDAVRVTDSEHAIMRMSPIAPCLALKERGIEPVMVINGRDRNRISFQADLLCASALGIKNIVHPGRA